MFSDIARRLVSRFEAILRRPFAHVEQGVETALILQARTLLAQRSTLPPPRCTRDAEFRVFSQYGEDGVLQWLVSATGVRPEERVFVEFGVHNYMESNTRLLLMKDLWRGVVIDGSPANIEFIRRHNLYWQYDITAVCAWIDRENINEVIRSAGVQGDIGILSIDLDGNDYWVWERIDVVRPVIVVVEWNSVFGPDHPVTVPYDSRFNRRSAHYSCLYWGASIAAFESLGVRKGFRLVGSNSAGNNLFFVREDRLHGITPVPASEAYVVSAFRDSRDRTGALNFLTPAARHQEILDLPVVDVEAGTTTTLRRLEARGQ